MKQALENPNLISLAAGFTDTPSLPVRKVQQAVDNLLGDPPQTEVLQYGTNAGRPGLRKALADRLSFADHCPEPRDPEEVLVTNGSQQALFLALSTLCDPGDIVLVESPTYFVFLENARALGLEVRSLPDTDDPEQLFQQTVTLLEDLQAKGTMARVKALYLVSYFSNPSSASRSEAEKEALAKALASCHCYPSILEDAAYRDLYYQKPWPARSILSLEAFAAFPCLYLGTTTKPFATGLKIGALHCPHQEWREKILHLKGNEDFGTANFAQAILEEVLTKGAYEDQVRKLRSLYQEKANILHHALKEVGLAKDGWHWKQPEGGLYLWLQGPSGFDASPDSPFFQKAIEEGVLFVPGSLCMASDHRKQNTVRLSFGSTSRENLKVGARRFAKAWQRLT
ncbi:MAG: PLP-dependent aminotransferase family protein [Opitutales bacterium]|nr:PLP-dependent aminotransferase family protein [Opitutales bacterium]